MPHAGLPNGPLSSSHLKLHINHVELLNPKYWLTSSPNGQRPNCLKCTAHIPIGLCISMAPKCWLARSRRCFNVPPGDAVQFVPQILCTDTNNAAEYEALLHGLRMAVSMGIQCLEVRGDSKLAISQINGDFDAKDPKMAAYRNAVLKMSAWFEGLEL